MSVLVWFSYVLHVKHYNLPFLTFVEWTLKIRKFVNTLRRILGRQGFCCYYFTELITKVMVTKNPNGVNLYCFVFHLNCMFVLSGIFIMESDFELLMRFKGPGVVENNNICQSMIYELDMCMKEVAHDNSWFWSGCSIRLRGTFQNL